MSAIRSRYPSSDAVVFGLLFIALASFAGCGGKQEEAVAQTKKFRPVDDAAAEEPAPAASGADFAAANLDSPRQATRPARQVTSEMLETRSSGTIQQPQTKSSPRAASQPAAVASGELQLILEQLDRLARQQPQGTNRQEGLEDLVRIHTQRLNLAKKALTLNPEPDVRRRVVMAIYEIHQVFAQLRLPNALAQLTEFGKTMSADADAEIARIGRHAAFSASLTRIASQPLADGKEIVAEAQKLLDAEKGDLSEATLDLIQQIAEMLNNGGFRDDIVALFESLAVATAADPKRADQSSQYTAAAKFMRSDLDTLLTDVMREEAGAVDKLVTTVAALLKELPASPHVLSRARDAAHILEATGNFEQAQTCYDHIAAAFERASDAELVAAAKEVAEKGKQRLALVGESLAVEGVMVDGQPFDWSAYAGKVILVDFWATWCGPCLQEMPNIKQNFEQYHAKGFEVVGVNLDTELADLKQFLTLQDLPWVSVTSQVVIDGQADKRDWTKLPMAEKCGVQAIPFVVLVGKDGKVDSIHVRGSKLKTRLTQLLGEPIMSEIPADPTQPAQPAAKAAGKQSRTIRRPAAITPASLLVVQALFAADPPEAATVDDASINPYRAKPGLTASQLIAYIERMLDRPQVIQTRAGFTEAIVEACDRVLAVDPSATDSERLKAAQTKLALLHRDACDGKEAADKQLMAFVEQLKDDSRPEISREVEFFRLERRVLDAKELPAEAIPALLKDVEEHATGKKLTGRHLRLASATVAAINRLENGDEREAHFASFGAIFAKSSDQELARYGKKLAKKPASREAASR